MQRLSLSISTFSQSSRRPTMRVQTGPMERISSPSFSRRTRPRSTASATAMACARVQETVFYVDGHVRVYHGHGAQLPRHYVARQKLYLRATADYWINALDGQPFFYINQEIDHGLVQALRNEVVTWLENNVPSN